MKGWVSLHRKIMNNWVWSNKPFAYGQAWIHLLLSANHEDSEILFDGKVITVKRGSFVTSILKLSNIFGWDRKKTSRFLKTLESQKMVTTNSTTHGTTITIVNWEKYQGLGTTNRTTNSTTDGTTEGQPWDTNNNDNKENNDNKKNKREVCFTPPTVEEVESYCEEKGYIVSASNFVDFYEAKGWMIGKNKMKDWKAAVRTWVRRNKSEKVDEDPVAIREQERREAMEIYREKQRNRPKVPPVPDELDVFK